MKKTDFLFIFEVRNRELENICLLKYELEKRGFSVEVIETWQYVYLYHEPFDATVVVSFAMYNDDVFKYIASFSYKMGKVVNLQWEQIYTNADEQNGSLYTVKGLAKDAVHISWGNFTVRRLIAMGVPEKNIELTGHISLDFLRQELNGYYESRNVICRKYMIPEKGKIHLFISSFSFIGMPDKTLQSDLYQSLAFDPVDFRQISTASQDIILEWFCSFLLKNKSDIIIYRPHPAEVGNKKILRVAQEYDNFFVISDESVKQWILIVDKIYTWYSTSIAEVLAAGKECLVLRPCIIPHSMDIPIYSDANFITTLDEFEYRAQSSDTFDTIPKEKLEEYYFIDKKEASYIKVCNVLEKVFNGDEFLIEQNDPIINMPLSGYRRFKKRIKYFFIKCLGIVSRYPIGKHLLSHGKHKLYDIGMDYNFTNELFLKNKTTKDEIENIQKRIATILEQ